VSYPSGVTESDFMAAAEHVVGALRGKFEPFAYYGREDIAQEVRMLAWQALPYYKPEAGALTSYLYRSCKNRLLNTLRAFQGRRNEPACDVCHAARMGRGPGHPDGQVCKVYAAWLERNRVKAALARPHDLVHSDESESRIMANSVAEADVEVAELLELLDERLGVDDRRVLLRMRDGVSVPKKERHAVERRVLAILEEVGLSGSDIGLDDDLLADEQEG
jgi:DNA-directed RNA polymerase specialized sigma24 family protein